MEVTRPEWAMRGVEQSTMLAGDATLGATERVIGDLAEFSSGAAKENVRLAAELQMAVIVLASPPARGELTRQE